LQAKAGSSLPAPYLRTRLRVGRGLDRAERLGDEAREIMVAEDDYILRFRQDLSFTAEQ